MPTSLTPTPPVPVVLIGGGGHALVIAEAAQFAGVDVVGFLDDDPSAAVTRLPRGPVHVAPLNDLPRIADRRWILSIGNVELRAEMLGELEQLELSRQAISIIHPSAFVSPSAQIGQGVYVGPRAIVHSNARVQDHAIINSGAIVEHDCVIGYNAHVAPGAVLGGGVRIGISALVGLGARVLPLLSVGDHAVVGAGAVVVKAVTDWQRVAGVPARQLTAPRV